ncbi:hypothetical protein OIO90_006094 [Microbotryomycetes sp. JL221]|nr:hypothetical protein OIO90_006094 [Microbotryomycetes sp. JL221]
MASYPPQEQGTYGQQQQQQQPTTFQPEKQPAMNVQQQQQQPSTYDQTLGGQHVQVDSNSSRPWSTGLAWILDLIQRGEIRKRYNIQGSGGGDCLTSCCCLPCSIGQQSRELAHEEQLLMGRTGAGQNQMGPGGKV